MSDVARTLDERGARYGDFSDHARVAQALQDTMRGHGWNKLSPTQRQALTVIADKIARILSGDPDYADNWHDIQGYAKLVEDRLPRQGELPVSTAQLEIHTSWCGGWSGAAACNCGGGIR